VGPGPRVRDWAIVFGGDEEAHYRGQRFAPRMAVRLLRTQRPAHQLYDLWARTPVSEAGVVVFGGDEEARYRGRRFTFWAHTAVRFFRTRSSAFNLYDLWARAPVS
jgi:hypothetical protein